MRARELWPSEAPSAAVRDALRHSTNACLLLTAKALVTCSMFSEE